MNYFRAPIAIVLSGSFCLVVWNGYSQFKFNYADAPISKNMLSADETPNAGAKITGYSTLRIELCLLMDGEVILDTANTWNAWTGVVSVNNTDNVPRLFKLEGSIRFVPYFAEGVAAADVAHYSIPHLSIFPVGGTVNFAAILNPHDYLMSTCRVIHKATGRAGINISLVAVIYFRGLNGYSQFNYAIKKYRRDP